MLITGTALAQLIPILLQPFLRRYFSPTEYGVYSVYVSIIGIIMVISGLRYEQAIVLPRRDSDASLLLLTALLFSLAINSVLFILIFIFHDSLQLFLRLTTEGALILYLIPLGTFFLTAFHALNFWLIRKKAFRVISYNKLVRRSVEGAIQSGAAITHIANGLVFGDIFGQFANISYSTWRAVSKGLSFSRFSLVRVRYLLRRYSDFPRYTLLPSLMSTASFLLPVVFINRFYSSEQAGYFDLAKLILSVPLALIAGSISSVVLQRASEKARELKPFFKEFRPLLFIVLAVAVVEILLIMLASESIFSLLFGSKWLISGRMAKLLVWAFALNFLTSSFTSLFVALNRVVWQSAWQVFYFILIVGLIPFAYLPFNRFIQLYVTFEIIANLSMLFLLGWLIRSYHINLRASDG